jgi:hypothetical protein
MQQPPAHEHRKERLAAAQDVQRANVLEHGAVEGDVVRVHTKTLQE